MGMQLKWHFIFTVGGLSVLVLLLSLFYYPETYENIYFIILKKNSSCNRNTSMKDEDKTSMHEFDALPEPGISYETYKKWYEYSLQDGGRPFWSLAAKSLLDWQVPFTDVLSG